MTTRIDPTQPIRDMSLLHPSCRKAFQLLEKKLLDGHMGKDTRTLFLPFETYRTPHRQRMLMENGKGVTKAGAFMSAHQYGMAVDFVPFADTWSWDASHDWEFLRSSAAACGLLRPLSWDLAHIEHPRWEWLRYDVTRL